MGIEIRAGRRISIALVVSPAYVNINTFKTWINTTIHKIVH